MTDDAFVATLRKAIGKDHVRTDPADIGPLLEDWRGHVRGDAVAAVFPGSRGDVAAVLQIATAAGRPVTPQGGNTGLSYGATPNAGERGIVLCLGRMRRILEIDRASNLLVVEAGATLAAVHEAALGEDRRMPLHLGSEGTAQIGGLISTNAGGTGAVRYGPMRDLVAGLEVVLPDGRVLSDLGGLKKNNTGYDLKQLFIGAEGTLGVVTAAALKLHPVLRSSASAWLAFDELPTAVALLIRLQERFDTAIQAVELVNGEEVDLVLRHIPRTRLPLEQVPRWSLMVELGTSDAANDLEASLEAWMTEIFEEGLLTDAFIARSGAQAEGIWHVRHSVSEANRIVGHSLSHDIAVRPSRVPDLVDRATAAVKAVYPTATILIVSHLGDGNVHFIVHFPHAEWDALPDGDAVTDIVMGIVHDIVADLGGTFSAEHGIGRKLVAELARRSDPDRLSLMRDLKGIIDPNGLMNPGALLAAAAPSAKPVA